MSDLGDPGVDSEAEEEQQEEPQSPPNRQEPSPEAQPAKEEKKPERTTDPKEEESVEISQVDPPLQVAINKRNMSEGLSEIEPVSMSEPMPNRQSVIEPTLTTNAIHFYRGSELFPWQLQDLEPTDCVQQLENEPLSFKEQLPYKNQIEIEVTGTTSFKLGMSQHISYSIEARDRNGTTKFSRRFTEHMTFRRVLIKMWPGIFIPVLPNKTLIGSSDQEIIRSRSKYLTHFWRGLTAYEQIYYSEEVQLFITAQENVNIEATYQKIEIPDSMELLERYKNVFGEAYSTSQLPQFMYRKESLPQQLNKYEEYFVQKKHQLVQWKESFKRLGESKKKYMKAVGKLNNLILPQYEDVLVRWFNGRPIKDNEEGIMQRMSRRSYDAQEKKGQESKKEEAPPIPVEDAAGAISQIHSAAPLNTLYTSEAYISRLEDTAYQLHNFNQPVWVLYDVIKFELKDTDSVVEVIEQLRQYQKQLDYLQRNISNNRDLIQDINNNKTSLKTFLMRGSEEEKKEKLNTENQNFEEKLEKLTELFLIMLVLIEQQLNAHHKERVEHYHRALKRSVFEELSVTKAIMDFHIYEYQLFGKERKRKFEQIFGKDAGGSKSRQGQEQIKQEEQEQER